MKVLIIEDEAPAFRRLQTVLEELNPSIQIIDVLDTVADSIKWFENHNPPDLIFMDIQLSDGISFDIFDNVEINTPVIFTTAYDEYTLRAFKVNSIDYVLKPIKKEALGQSLTKFYQFKEAFGPSNTPNLNQLLKQIKLEEKQYKTRFLIKMKEALISIESDDIAYFQTRHGVVYLYNHAGRNYLIDYTLEELAQQINPTQFFRANRQFLINFKSILTVHKYHKNKLLIETSPAAKAPIIVSSERAATFKKWLGDKK